jgi:hypothetical protein
MLSFKLQAQNHSFYLRVANSETSFDLVKDKGRLLYLGEDEKLSDLFKDNNIYKFEKAFYHSRKSELQRTYIMESDKKETLANFLKEGGHIFDFGESLGITQNKLTTTYPNDYGQTGGSNLGLNANLSNLDCIDAPKAWKITTGKKIIKIGISDGGVIDSDEDLNGKINVLTNSQNDQYHGTGVSAIAAAKGNNEYGIVGVCRDCHLITTFWNVGDYDRLLDLSYAGSKIINCSWGAYRTAPSITQQLCIDEIYENGSIIVASSNNESWQAIQGNLLSYPASYEHVISVGSVAQRHDSPLDSLVFMPSVGQWWSHNIKNHIGRALVWNDNPNVNPNATYTVHPNGTNTLNEYVDILAPGNELFKYGSYVEDGSWGYSLMHTSGAAPHVTGVLGLMYTLNECLTFEEAESILKIGSTNIDHIQANQFAAGNYGSGSLNAHKSVKLTKALISPNEIAYVEDQIFSRWDFVLNGVSKNIILKNQIFKEESSLHIKSKNSIELQENTLLLPSTGVVELKIEDNLIVNTNCINENNTVSTKRYEEDENDLSLVKIFPTLFDDKLTIKKESFYEDEMGSIKIYSLLGVEVFSLEDAKIDNLIVNLSHLTRGVYVVQVLDSNKEVVFTKKIIKK